MTKTRIALFASGSGSNAKKMMEFFGKHPFAEVGLLLANKSDAGALVHAETFGVPHAFVPNSAFKEGDTVVKLLQEHSIDVIVLAGFLLLIPPAILKAYPNRMVNIHPALLPKYGGKGMYGHFVHEAVAEAGETESGITVHLVSEQYDEGPILAQYKVNLEKNESPLSIETKVRQLEIAHYASVVESWIAKRREGDQALGSK